MNIALIAPTRLLPRYGSLTNFHLCLAHLIIQDKDYREFYQERSKAGDYIIVDNGAYELGKSIPPADLAAAALEVGADELVIPDVYRDAPATLGAFHDFLDNDMYGWNGEIMAVPQAQDAEEWLMTLRSMQQEFVGVVDTWGIPKWLGESTIWGRIKLASLLDPDLTYHLLGCATPREVAPVAKYEYIRSMDTSFPFVYGLLGRRITTFYNRMVERPDGYFQLKDNKIGYEEFISYNVVWLFNQAEMKQWQ